jgi:DNA-3-methyladenine glycosylase
VAKKFLLSAGLIPDSEGLKKAIKISREIPIVATLGEKFPAILNAEFFKCDALELAPKLLGKLLRRDDVVLQITEVFF